MQTPSDPTVTRRFPLRARILATALLVLCGFGVAGAADAPYYRARKGDTLWDLAGKRWKNPFSWPELWSLNPHISNPHRIEPGDPIFFRRRSSGAEVRLPLEHLGQVETGAPASGTVPVADAGTAAGGGAPKAAVPVGRRKGGDFVSAHRVARAGTVDNRGIVKVIYGQGDDLEFRVAPDSRLQAGDLATVFDDSQAVEHPVNREPQGYLVRILGHLRVRSAANGRGIGSVVESYDTIGDGAGVMPYREPVASVTAKVSAVGVEGVILQGNSEKTLFSAFDVVFLDRGSLHGLEPGTLLEIPAPDKENRPAEGLVDLARPLARLLVFSVEDKSAASLIVESRATVEQGDRFVTTAISP